MKSTNEIMRIKNFYQHYALNESVLEFSKMFINLLKSIKKDPIADKIISLWNEKKDLDFIYNFIDIADKQDTVSFTPDKKIKELLGTPPKPEDIVYKFVKKTKGLKVNSENAANKKVFNALGFTGKENRRPYEGTQGKIKFEYHNPKTNKTWILFKPDTGSECVTNKENLIEIPSDEKNKIWAMKKRNTIKVGRIARSIIESTGEKVTDKEIENFVNAFKSAYDVMNNIFAKLELVTGDKIAYWYSDKNYENRNSRLGMSCMSRVPSNFLDIYTKNSAAHLLIMYADGGKIDSDGKYRSDKICARAMVWQTDEGDIFMDNVYANKDNIDNIYREFAEKNGWWFSENKTWHSRPLHVTNGKITKKPIYIISLEQSEFDKYPHPDVFEYLNTKDKKLCSEPETINADRYLNHTDGGYNKIYGKKGY